MPALELCEKGPWLRNCYICSKAQLQAMRGVERAVRVRILFVIGVRVFI